MKLFAANWKMYLSHDDALKLIDDVAKAASTAKCEVVVAPSLGSLASIKWKLQGAPVGLAGQDAFWEDAGAYTGAVSAPMLRELGATYVILGHSERRAYFGETDETVAKKVAAVQRAGLTPIVCVGETAEEKERGERDAVVRRQLEAAIETAVVDADHRLVVAYEPRWAIGTGKACLPEDALPVLELIRAAAKCQVLYGGSVDAKNIAGFIGNDAFDGVLVGGASTKTDKVSAMIAAFS